MKKIVLIFTIILISCKLEKTIQFSKASLHSTFITLKGEELDKAVKADDNRIEKLLKQ